MQTHRHDAHGALFSPLGWALLALCLFAGTIFFSLRH